MKKTRYALLTAFAIALGLAGCGNPASAPTATTTKTYVYAVDTNSGKVFQIDPSTNAVASTALVTIGQNSSGEIRFGAGKAFVAVASYNNVAPGLYYFDPSSSSPAAAMVGSIKYSAQYICIVSNTLGYVSVADYTPTGKSSNGVYSFNPSSPSSGLTAVYTASTIYPQDLVMAADGCLYVANGATNVGQTSDSVLKLDLSSGTPAVTLISLTSSGPTGMLAGSYQGNAGVFVAETGGYTAGSIDFIPCNATSVESVISTATGKIFARMAAFNASTLIATGGYPARTYLVSLSGTPGAAEVSCNSTSFGSMDVDVIDNIAYIPDGSQAVYAVTSSGVATKIAVGSSSDSITNVGIGTIEE
jgi:hypothetical protein